MFRSSFKVVEAVLIWLVFSTNLSNCIVKLFVEEDFAGLPNTALDSDGETKIFEGRKDEEFFLDQILVVDSYFLIGSINVFYNLSAADLTVNRNYSWPPDSITTDLCKLNHEEEECNNFIKVILLKSNESKEIVVCGSNAYKPKCKPLLFDEGIREYKFGFESEGRGYAPNDPNSNSTAISINGKIFSAIENWRDSFIYNGDLRTQSQNSYILYEPHFVGSTFYRGVIYFFFRETAMEYLNCGNAVFSRVARLCPNDRGGLIVLRNNWATFFKSRMTCSFPGKYPFHFNEIQSMSDLGFGSVHVDNIRPSEVFYAVFNTPSNGLLGSAICAFKMTDILYPFMGKFKGRRDEDSLWKAISNSPTPHPADMCPENTQSSSDATLNFILTHPLMNDNAESIGKQPIYAQTGFKFSLTKIAVDFKRSANSHNYDVIFIGTDVGTVLKLFNLGTPQNPIPKLIEILTIGTSKPVKGLKIITDQSTKEKKLLIITVGQVLLAPLHRCGAAKVCWECLALKDPYCFWKDDKCTESDSGLQSLVRGTLPECPAPQTTRPPTTKSEPCPTMSSSFTPRASILIILNILALELYVR